MATSICVKDVKRGDFVRFVDSYSAPVWIRGEYERSSRIDFIDFDFLILWINLIFFVFRSLS